MSSRAGFCSRCGYSSGEISEEQQQLIAIRQLRDKVYRLKMTSYAVITVFLGSFGWVWSSSGGFESRPPLEPFLLMGATVVIYLVIRALLFKSGQRQKQLKKKLRKFQR